MLINHKITLNWATILFKPCYCKLVLISKHLIPYVQYTVGLVLSHQQYESLFLHPYVTIPNSAYLISLDSPFTVIYMSAVYQWPVCLVACVPVQFQVAVLTTGTGKGIEYGRVHS